MSYLVTTKKKCDGPCGLYRVIYKVHGRLKYCKACWSLHLRIGTPVSSFKVKKSSSKRASEENEYTRERRVFLTEFPNCQARLPGCMLGANQVHHKKGRLGDLLLDKRYWLATCAVCHDIIEKESEAAKESGLSESRLNNQEDV